MGAWIKGIREGLFYSILFILANIRACLSATASMQEWGIIDCMGEDGSSQGLSFEMRKGDGIRAQVDRSALDRMRLFF